MLMSLMRPPLVRGPSNARPEWPGPEDNFKETRVLNREVAEVAGVRCLRFSIHWDLCGARVSSILPTFPSSQPCLFPQQRSSEGRGTAWSHAWSVRGSVVYAEGLRGSPGVALGEWGRLTPRIHEDATRRRARSSQRSARRREAGRERPRLHLAMNYVWPAG